MLPDHSASLNQLIGYRKMIQGEIRFEEFSLHECRETNVTLDNVLERRG